MKETEQARVTFQEVMPIMKIIQKIKFLLVKNHKRSSKKVK